ncbi:MAG: hypothetical protein L0219_16505, partial [Phycisphaerales bacterium]|nr:hypothetical protein [Phycisphaerales bacterium]
MKRSLVRLVQLLLGATTRRRRPRVVPVGTLTAPSPMRGRTTRSPRRRRVVAPLALVLWVFTMCGLARPAAAQAPQSISDFASQVDLTRLGQVAIHTEGRVKSLDSHARALMQLVSG